MRFDTKALLKLMKQSWRGGGVKIQRTEHRGLWDSFFITGAGWALLIPKENCPGEIAGQIVTWLADMPKIGESKWVVKGCDPQDIPEDDRTIDISRYTTGNYETGMACLPLCTATDALIQYGADDRAAAFLWTLLPWYRPVRTSAFWIRRPASPAGKTKTLTACSGSVTTREMSRRTFWTP